MGYQRQRAAVPVRNVRRYASVNIAVFVHKHVFYADGAELVRQRLGETRSAKAWMGFCPFLPSETVSYFV
jgi:hypothetical protein